ncbi:hypothetical protein UY3_06428 [Chelonia mydas]|uniref:Uncharacterized protein n=1 Tax=Chelonia mydas TaxID=8469 RepID=M7BES7_CHEMY|nr:hypothetical protein UY3_06428 [Chelonia mydas]
MQSPKSPRHVGLGKKRFGRLRLPLAAVRRSRPLGAAGSGGWYVPRPVLLPAAPIGLEQQTADSGSRDRPNLRTRQLQPEVSTAYETFSLEGYFSSYKSLFPQKMCQQVTQTTRFVHSTGTAEQRDARPMTDVQNKTPKFSMKGDGAMELQTLEDLGVWTLQQSTWWNAPEQQILGAQAPQQAAR